MKAEQYILVTESVKNNAIERLKEIEANGKTKISFSDAGSKSQRQRGLQWKWYTEVAESGIGGKHEDTKNGVHLVSKYIWGVPILKRDNDFFNELYQAWFDKYENDSERLEWFVENHVHTESFSTSQMAEFLNEFERHYLAKGVNLTNPALYGLKQSGYGNY